MISRIIVLALALFIFGLSESKAVNSPPPTATHLSLAEFATLTHEELAIKIGRPLKGKEKAALWLAKRKIRRELRRHPERADEQLDWSQISPEKRPTNKAGVFSLLLGILGFLALSSLVEAFLTVGFIILLMGLALSLISLWQFRKHPGRFRGIGYAIAGLIISGGFVLLIVLALQ
jgi:hypothetical protein